jgi:hypothetical protein
VLFTISESHGLSPSFSTQEIIEPQHNDLQPDPNSTCPDSVNSSLQDYIHIPDISAVSYYSNGTILNATVILSQQFKNVSSYVAYHMIIGPQSGYDYAGHGRHTYVDTIYSENDPQKWKRWIYEQFSNGFQRTVYKNENYSGFFNRENDTISFSLDLSKIGYPSNYLLSFDAQDGFSYGENQFCNLIDTTHWYPIPLPSFTISMVPSSVEIRPGEEIDIELTAKANIDASSNITFYPRDINGLQISVNPKKISIPPLGSNVSSITIKARDSFGDRLLPSVNNLYMDAVLTIPDLTFLKQGSGNVRGESLTENLSKTFSNLTITLLPNLKPEEQFAEFWKSYGDFIGLVAGGFIAGLTALVMDRIKKKN